MSATTVQPRRGFSRDEEPEWLVWVTVLVMLAIGLTVRTVVTSRSQPVEAAGLALRVPADWTALAPDTDSAVLRVSEPLETSLFPATVTVSKAPLAATAGDDDVTLGDLALKWTNQQGQDLLSYRVLSIEPASVGGREAVRINFVYVAEPVLSTPNAIPIVAEGEDVLLRQGDQLVVARFLSEADAYEAKSHIWNTILGSLKLEQE